MAGLIEINAGKSWSVAGWVFRNVLRDTLPHIWAPGNEELVVAMNESLKEGQLEHVSLIGLDFEKKKDLAEALTKALRERLAAGVESFGDPEYYGGYIDRFDELIGLLEEDLTSMRNREKIDSGQSEI